MHCAKNIVSMCFYVGSASAERVGQVKVGRVIRRVPCTWWLLGLAVKGPWLAPGSPPPSHPDGMDRLRKHYFHLVEGWFVGRKAAFMVSEQATDSADHCMLVIASAWPKAGSGQGFSF